mgnify:CR=1 FL=1
MSTATAFLVASMGFSVAKHGNYGSVQPNGSFDFLDALQVPYQLSEAELVAQFEKTGLCFLLAKNFHPAMRFVMPARRALGCRTIFNLLGPLCNPASVTHQVIGTTTIAIAEKLATAIQQLGTNRTLIVVGGDGRDELSLVGRNTIFEVTHDHCRQFEWESEESVSVATFGDAKHNAALFLELLSDGNGDHPVMRYILANVGVALYCLGQSDSIDTGIAQARSWFKKNSDHVLSSLKWRCP